MSDEFDRQVATLLARGYPKAAGLGRKQFLEMLAPLRDLAAALPRPRAADHIPFVVVIDRSLIAAETALARVELGSKASLSAFAPGELQRFQPTQAVRLPGAAAYLLADVEAGLSSRNVTPDDALGEIRAKHRSPLTVEEGLAVVTHFPESIRKGHGFSLLASRCGDRRVPALWVSQKRPKLGWCWAGNPHTWLGSASCRRRVAGR